jgi:3-oxoadipate enol-lactonase
VQVPNTLPVRVYGDDGDGSRTPLVLIHSIAMSMELWDNQVEELARDRPVIVYDQRGNGAAEATAPPYSVQDLGTDLLGILDSLGYQKASVCGLSLGGLVAMWFAASHPERIDRLIVACTSAHPGAPEKWAERAQLALAQGMPAVIEQSSRGWFTPEFAAANPDVLIRLRAIAESCSPVGYAGCCAVLQTTNLLSVLHLIEAPTLVLAGARDRGFPAEHAEAIHAGISGSNLITMANVAHIASVEDGPEFSRLVLAHLAESEK